MRCRAAPRYRLRVANPDRDPTDPTELTISDEVVAQRYEARFDGDLAGFLEYRLVGARRILVHTEVLEAFAGRGVGTALARHALDVARAAGTRVTVKCPFINAWLERHPEYAGMATTRGRGRARDA